MLANEAAKLLLDVRAVSLQPEKPFTWSSGLKSPIYCDNRLLMSFPEERKRMMEMMASYVTETFGPVEVLAGTATAGIPHAAWIADRLHLPMVYVRSSSKGHGKQNRIEGVLSPKQKVVVIEDLISTGGSSIEAANAVKEAGGEVIGICSIFTYGLPVAEQSAETSGYRLASLTNYQSLLATALSLKYITEEELEQLKTWRHDPKAWSESRR
ncbi:orotate phosphoribosyltransferase [Bacillus sp. A301a_S52]|nr:orotate phosphoribosyltransferase [Bacillus sp. A301a_S52]